MLIFFNIAFLFSTCLFAFSAFFYPPAPGLPLDHHIAVLGSLSHNPTNLAPSTNDLGLLAELVQSLMPIPSQSLTAILPILPHTLDRTTDLIQPFLRSLQTLRELLVICPDSITADVRRELQRAFASLGSAAYPDVSLRPWRGYMQVHAASLKSATEVSTEWVLLMDENGLAGTSEAAKWALLNPPDASVPFGPEGHQPWSDLPPTISCRWGRVQVASHLLPPFVMPSVLSSAVGVDMNAIAWDMQVSPNISGLIGGILLGSTRDQVEEPAPPQLSEPNHGGAWYLESPLLNNANSPTLSTVTTSADSNIPGHIHILMCLPVIRDVERLSPFLCRLMHKDPRPALRLLVYDDEKHRSLFQSKWLTGSLVSGPCIIEYDIFPGAPLSFSRSGNPAFSEWLETYATAVDILLTVEEMDPLAAYLLSNHRAVVINDATLIRIPRRDLEYADWMASLTVEEMRNWHTPTVDVSIITKDRPASLLRLLRSLHKARYFGDEIGLRINVEQDCDIDSLRIVENVSWPYGRVFIHHRVVHGGLLPAVVESWYPHGNDSYGVLLEDDVEVSPLFYAWIKMTVLRYRYGEPQNRLPQMFGISLYQQKHLELPIGGRQSFNPRSLFSQAGLPQTSTPYLSQVPCSWGALYFPEQWREFYDYLAARLTETALTMEDEVVPNVRSNYWTRSWKKFFIELVYLRGCLMLYPNYENFISLSTNHLEVGSHVKVRSQEKQDLFLLPLMELPTSGETSKLLDLPDRRLPGIEQLPVLNLTGFLSSRSQLLSVGMSRRRELTGCEESPARLYDVHSLLCINRTLGV